MRVGMLQDKVALITGSASGIGRGIARRFVREGAKIVMMDISEQALVALSSELGQSAIPIVGDVSSWTDNLKAVATAVETFGKLDIFVGNAGIYDHAVALEDMDGSTLSMAFEELFSINVKGYMLGIRASLDALLASSGNVVLTGSFASASPAGGGSLYTASKHAVLGLVKQLAYELAPDIRVNGVAPGIAPTVLKGVTALGQSPKDSILDGAQDIIPLQSVPDADAYGGMYAMLASERESSHITGSMLIADSGLAIRGFGKSGGRVGRS
ncbi:3-phenylpropionate-dihydrodiol/cinnamic acid-dihydrodiol dehydrogenase [Alcaligenes] [Alcaligenes phenolicus]